MQQKQEPLPQQTKRKKPLKLTKATYIAAGAGVVVLLIAAAVIWFMIQRKQEEERMRVLREKRRKRLADMGCSGGRI